MGVLDYLVRYTDMNILLTRQPCRMSHHHKGTRDITYASLCKTGIRAKFPERRMSTTTQRAEGKQLESEY